LVVEEEEEKGKNNTCFGSKNVAVRFVCEEDNVGW